MLFKFALKVSEKIGSFETFKMLLYVIPYILISDLRTTFAFHFSRKKNLKFMVYDLLICIRNESSIYQLNLFLIINNY
jgi:hypothetical protein